LRSLAATAPEPYPDKRGSTAEWVDSTPSLNHPFRSVSMLWTIFVILLVLWALGMVSSYTLGGFIHILLVLALAVLLINLLSGRRPTV
jgi:hypothetical protein